MQKGYSRVLLVVVLGLGLVASSSGEHIIGDQLNIVEVDTKDMSLVVEMPSQVFTYVNSTPRSIALQEAGEYRFTSVNHSSGTNSTWNITVHYPQHFTVSEQSRVAGKPLHIYVFNSSTYDNLSLIIRSPVSSYVFDSIVQPHIEFLPQHNGSYEIALMKTTHNASVSLHTAHITIASKPRQSHLTILSKSIVLGEHVIFEINTSVQNDSLLIRSQKKQFGFSHPQGTIMFLPEEAGRYTFEYAINDTIQETGSFTVHVNRTNSDDQNVSKARTNGSLWNDDMRSNTTYVFDLRNYTQPFRSFLHSLFSFSPLHSVSVRVLNTSNQTSDHFIVSTSSPYEDVFVVNATPHSDTCGSFTLALSGTLKDSLLYATYPIELEPCSGSHITEEEHPSSFSFPSQFNVTLDFAPVLYPTESAYRLERTPLLEVATDIRADINETLTIETKKHRDETLTFEITAYENITSCITLEAVLLTQNKLVVTETRICPGNTTIDIQPTQRKPYSAHISVLLRNTSLDINSSHSLWKTMLVTDIHSSKRYEVASHTAKSTHMNNLSEGSYTLVVVAYANSTFYWNEFTHRIESLHHVHPHKQHNGTGSFLRVRKRTGMPQYAELKKITKKTTSGLFGIARVTTEDYVGSIPNSVVERITLRGLQLTSNSSLGYDENIPTHVLKDRPVQRIYALDPSTLAFDNGEFTVNAQGKELWKCAKWDFASQQCNGQWVKLQNIRPGENYTVPLSHTDPAFAEVGLASINTDRDKYLPNATVEITAVVLDQQGYLVDNAAVDILVTHPNGTLWHFSTESQTITAIRKGVYTTTFRETTAVGNYSIFVRATNSVMNNTMMSHFVVDTHLPFHIIRNVPPVIDPWSGPYNSSVQIISTSYANPVTVHETLPRSFTIQDAPGAIITQMSEAQLITWHNVANGSTLSYVAQAPLITPELYEIGPLKIDYTQNRYIEARPWYLAIDPVYLDNFFLFWDSSTDAPSGWSCVSCDGGGAFYRRLIRGSDTYGGTGGGDTHTHTISLTSTVTGTEGQGRTQSSTAVAAPGHTHSSLTGDSVSTESLYPSYRTLKVISYSGMPGTIPEGAIAIFNTSSLPADWERYTAHDGYFILANDTANVTGGSNTHTHTTTAGLGASSGTVSSRSGTPAVNAAAAAHTHGADTGASSSEDLRPPFIEVVLARATSDTTIPYGQGFVAMFDGSVLPEGWDNISQQGRPFYNRHIAAAANYGGTGGTDTHVHDDLTLTAQNNAAFVSTRGGQTNTATGSHGHEFSVSFDTKNNLPRYINVSFGYAIQEVTSDNPPSVTLTSPADYYNATARQVTLECTVTDGEDLVNVSLYTNHSGTFALNDSIAIDGSGNLSYDATFTVTGLPNVTGFVWNCLAFDSNDGSTFATANRTVNVNVSEQPLVSLISPANDSVQTEDTISFTCRARDDEDIASMSLYTGTSPSSLSLKTSTSFTGASDTDVTHEFSPSGFDDLTYYYWNCRAIDNESNVVDGSAPRTIFVNKSAPVITSMSPENYNISTNITAFITCEAEDNNDIVNISLYTSLGGSFAHEETIDVSGSSDTTASVTFNVTGSYGDIFYWNCLVTDNNSLSDWGDTNKSISLAERLHFYGSLAEGTWLSSSNALGSPDTTTADDYLHDDHILSIDNLEGVPTQGILLRTYLTMAWRATPAEVDDDELEMAYSLENYGGTNYDLDGSGYGGTSQPDSWPDSLTNSSYEITGSLSTSDLANMRLRIRGDRNSGEDDNLVYMDSLYLSIYFDYYPTPGSQSKDMSTIYQNTSVHFYANWSDDHFLSCYIFSINQSGTWENQTCVPFSDPTKSEEANITYFVNATPGSTVEWRFYANDSSNQFNASPIQTFQMADANDNIDPTISNEQVNPTTGYGGTTYNISATVTDNTALSSVYAEITYPNGSAKNFSMSNSQSVYSYFYTGFMGGNYSVRVIAIDGANNTNTSQTSPEFNVTAYMYTPYRYYERGETIPITGTGFSQNQKVTLHLYNKTGQSVSGYPVNETANSSGGFRTTWSISSSLTSYVWNRTIEANDTYRSALKNSTFITIVTKSDTSTRYDDNAPAGDIVTTDLNQSDDSTTTIVSDSTEAYLNLRFRDLILEGYTLDSLYLLVEHADSDPDSDPLLVHYYDGDAYQSATCTSIPFSATNTIGVCDLTADIASLPDANDIRIRLTDNNDGAEGADFSTIDFAYLLFDFSITNTLTVDILTPTNVETTSDFTDTTSNVAYEGSHATEPPPPGTLQTGTAAEEGDYTNIDSSNDNRWQSTSSTNGQFVYQSFFLYTSIDSSDVVQIDIYWEGYFTTDAANAEDFSIFLWNYSGDFYYNLNGGDVAGTSTDQELSYTVPGNATQFIDTDGEMNIFVSIANKKVGSTTRQDAYTDYVYAKVYSPRTLSGSEYINVTAVDADGVQSCTINFINISGYRFSDTYMTNVSSIDWYNVTETTQYADGKYNLTANCTDGTEYDQDSLWVRINNVGPWIALVTPETNSAFTVDDVNFTWNATQSSGNPVCDLLIDGSAVQEDITSTNGAHKTVQENDIADGTHTWSVRCENTAGIQNTSHSWNFTIDTTAPSVTHISPSGAQSTSNTTFTYSVSDFGNLNCSLYINEVFNATNTSVPSGSQSTFYAEGFTQGRYNWTVYCTDQYNYTGDGGYTYFQVDLSDPEVQLNNPAPEEVIVAGVMTFNWTATDSFDSTLSCDIMVNSANLYTGISTTNSTPQTQSHEFTGGTKYWNVTCTDDAGRSNTSTTRNFTVQGDPTVELKTPDNGTSQNVTEIALIYFVDDTDTIQNCSLYLNDQLDQTNDTNEITKGRNNNFSHSISSEGTFNWSVTCYDDTDAYTDSGTYQFTPDWTKPNITLDKPSQNQNFQTGDITFNFTAYDNLDSSLTCTLLIDGYERTAANVDFEAVNGTLQSRAETGLSGGWHDWEVTCTDDAGLEYASGLRDFLVGLPPTVTLSSPGDGDTASENVTFTYSVTDTDSIENCTLLINDTLYDENTTITGTGTQTFSYTSFGEGIYNWSVACTDEANLTDQSEYYDITIDNSVPSVTAVSPSDTTETSQTVTFNFTVTDNFDSAPTCNITINATVEDPSFAATNGSNERSVGSLSSGTHFWNVTCWDNANHTATSNTLNFTIILAPDVSLQNPVNKTTVGDGNVSFEFIVDNNDIKNCTLYINSNPNKTINSSDIVPSGISQINVSNLTSQKLNWSVNCTNNDGVTGVDPDEPYTLWIDFVGPNASLNNPVNGKNFSYGDVTLNFTVTDDLKETLYCNITINGERNQTNVEANNGTPKTVDVTGFGIGTYWWNVTCTDGLYNDTSETWNFSIVPEPTIDLVSPENNSVDGDGYITFSYIPYTINESGFFICQLTLDGSIVNETFPTADQNGETNYIYRSGISEARHSWSVNCTDYGGYEGKSETWYFINDLTDPTITLYYPNETTLNSSFSFNFSSWDNLATELDCNLSNNGTVYTGITAQNNTPTTYAVSGLTDGFYYWNVSCSDDVYRSNTSVTLNFTVAEIPAITLTSPDPNTRRSQTGFNFTYTPVDNSGSFANCSLIINDAVNTTNSTIYNGSSNNFTVNDINHGSYNWTVNCTDTNDNSGSASPNRMLYVDIRGPTIALEYPGSGDTLNNNDLNFSWNASDFDATIDLNCTLFVTDDLGEGDRTVENISGTSHAWMNYTLTNLSDGQHYWNVTCWDDLNNSNYSETQSFVINQPDLVLFTQNITFNDTNPDINATINITANITNIGGRPATNALIEFYDGYPASGTYIGNDTITVAVGETVIAHVLWNITPGFHTVFVIADRQGSISELNETNNNATNNISALYPKINDPVNGALHSSQTVDFNFTLADYRGATINYVVFIDAKRNVTGTATDNQSFVLGLNFSDGNHDVNIEANASRVDYHGLSLTRAKNSSTVSITVDSTDPEPLFITENKTWFSTTTPQIFFNITDTIDLDINYTLFRDGNKVNWSSVANNTRANITLADLTDGSYVLILEAFDDAGNRKNTTPLTIYIDTQDPTPVIHTANHTNFSDSTPPIRMNISDNLASTINYTLVVTSSTDTQGTVSNNTVIDANLSSQADGSYRVYVMATDKAGNTANSSEINITIDVTPPSLSIDNPQTDEVLGYLVQLMTTPSDATLGLDTVWFEVVNNSDDVVFRSGDLNATAGWDAVWNSTKNLSNGNHTVYVNFSVYANDTLGNQQNASVRFIIDNTNPSVDIFFPNQIDVKENFNLNISVQNHHLNNSYVNITNTTGHQKFYVLNDSIGIASYWWTDLVNISNTTTYTEGIYNISVFAGDVVGNNYSIATWFRVDRTAPGIQLNEPANNSNFTETSITLNYTPTDNFDAVIECNLTLNGTAVNTSYVENNTKNSVLRTGLTSGRYNWYVTCADDAGNSSRTGTQYFTIDTTAPIIGLGDPENNTQQQSTDVTFFYTPYEAHTEILNCSLILNNEVEKTNVTLFNGDQNNFSVTGLAENRYLWTVNCTDTMGKTGTNATPKTLVIDSTAPYVTLRTANHTWFSTSQPNISFNASDALNSVINFTLFVDGIADVSNVTNNNTNISYSLTTQSEGNHTVVVEVYDGALNRRNSSTITIYVDTTEPNVTGLYPQNGTELSTTGINFTWKSIDNLDSNSTCNLTINDVVNATGMPTLNNTLTNLSRVLAIGNYNWSIACSDNAHNSADSGILYFNITPPDLEVLDTSIYTTNVSIREGDNITLFVNVSNEGTGNAGSFDVEFFNGIPGQGATQIGESHTISALVAGAKRTLNTTWLSGIGDQTIFVRVDYAESVTELDETNNNASIVLNISSWSYFIGNNSGDFGLKRSDLSSMFLWNITNETQGNIFAADSDASISWTSLIALTRNTTGDLVMDDISELDTVLNGTTFTDNVNATYTNGSVLTLTQTYIVYQRSIQNVPVANSTNNSNFITGILWDSSDENDGEYNGTQDIVFISEINTQKQGAYGVYNFELRAPSELKRQITDDAYAVKLYMEFT